jgi:hypothetical protein
MNDTGDEASSLNSEYLIPPLSPAKTVSTEGWLSPRTPGSPRKSRSCPFFQDVDSAIRNLYLTPSSPTKSQFSTHDEAFTVSVSSATNCGSSPVQPYNAPDKSQQLSATDPHSSLAIAHTLSSPVINENSTHDEGSLSQSSTHSSSSARRSSPPKERRRSNRVSSKSSATISSYTGPSTVKSLPQSQLRRLPSRFPGSPMRLSPSAARGGSVESPRYSQTGTPDRFIAYRRPPAVARESFELNSPEERRKREQAVNRGTHTNADAFSRRLRRSDRMNEELRGLREAHSVILGRTNASRRNIRFRRGSIPLAARQISAGAV